MARRCPSSFFLSARVPLQGRGSQTRSLRWIWQLRDSTLRGREDTQVPDTIHRFFFFKNRGSGLSTLAVAIQMMYEEMLPGDEILLTLPGGKGLLLPYKYSRAENRGLTVRL